MADKKALGALPADHWIHKALAKTKKRKQAAPADKGPAMATYGKPAC